MTSLLVRVSSAYIPGEGRELTLACAPPHWLEVKRWRGRVSKAAHVSERASVLLPIPFLGLPRE